MMYILFKNLPKAGSTLLLAFLFPFWIFGQEVKSLSGANSPQDDQNPVWIGSNTLLFSRAFHPENLGGTSDPGDIWMTQREENGEWGQAIHRPDLSTEGYDIPLGLEDVLTLLVFHRDGERNGIYQYSKFGTDWNFLRKIEVEGLDKIQGDLQGRVNKEGNLIFISGIATDGIGNDDLFVSKKIGPINWSMIQNLGSVINTPGQEVSPFFDTESSQLYFASNMHPSANGKDIFIAKALDESYQNWSKPVKWEQLSSPGSESSVTFISSSEVVWTSTQNSDGFADLLTFTTPVPLEIPDEFETPEAIVSQPEKSSEKSTQSTNTMAPIFPLVSIGIPEVKLEKKEIEEAAPRFEVSVIDEKSKSEINNFRLSQQAKGNVELLDAQNLNLEMIDAEIRVEAPGYFPKNISKSFLRPNTPTVIALTKLEAGANILLDAVRFRRGTAELEGAETITFLDDLAEVLNESDGFKIRISGHTDGAGDPGLNKALSLERAGAVRDFLVEKGVPFERLRIAGWGGTRPLASNATEVGRSKNRRVELTIEN
ncbi:OmpA family protein [Algoriphagus hitonicola]|uniref:Outer membrane protein OmpA n=1 Tax=Algoriphagus hitonicola TaxID=435880 RepID=A0A1I2R3E8_9BACT|nr:OmpA family protein [Algoriphagus hitonicola]SFG34920.1 Outer membrane protein OmpA [Algoriphagus hitonicola]